MEPNTPEQPGILKLSLSEAILRLSTDSEKSFWTRAGLAREQHTAGLEPLLTEEHIDIVHQLHISDPVEVNVLPVSLDDFKQQVVPVSYSDGRGSPRIGIISGINVRIDFPEGDFCYVHPAAILASQPYTSGRKARLIDPTK